MKEKNAMRKERKAFRTALSLLLALMLTFTSIMPVALAAEVGEDAQPPTSVVIDGTDTSAVPNDADDTAPAEDPVIEETPPTEEPAEPIDETAEPEDAEEDKQVLENVVTVDKFVELAITNINGEVSGMVGTPIELAVELNRDDVAVKYQWQKADINAAVNKDYKPLYDYGDGISSNYLYLITDMTEAEFLSAYPDATFPGIEEYYAQLEAAGGDASQVHIERGAENKAFKSGLVNNFELADVDEFGTITPTEAAWSNIEGETNPTFSHIVDENDEYCFYRCIVTIVDETYFKAVDEYNEAVGVLTGVITEEKASTEPVQEPEPADKGDVVVPEDETQPETDTETAPQPEAEPEIVEEVPSSANAASDGEAVADGTETPDANPDATIYMTSVSEDALTPVGVSHTLTSMTVTPNLTTLGADQTSTGLGLMSAAMLSQSAAPNVYLDGSVICGVNRNIEYITEDALNYYPNASAQGSPYWTNLNGGTRADGSTYVSAGIINGRTPVLSAWYGKTVYFRIVGNSGLGTAIKIPAYSSEAYQTGEKQLYKKAVAVLSIRVPETGGDFYSSYLNALTGYTDNSKKSVLPNGNGCEIFVSTAPLTPYGGANANNFNVDPNRYLLDAEGNYRFDSVMCGVCVGVEPDLSAKAAYALRDYIAEGYGFMIGHDMLYSYGGVATMTDANGNVVANRNYAPITALEAETVMSSATSVVSIAKGSTENAMTYVAKSFTINLPADGEGEVKYKTTNPAVGTITVSADGKTATFRGNYAGTATIEFNRGSTSLGMITVVVNENPYTATPYYNSQTGENGHYNMAFLLGANDYYNSGINPYDTQSMVLCIANAHTSNAQKKYMYGDKEGSSTIRIAKTMSGNAVSDVSLRCPTNYPYAYTRTGESFVDNYLINTVASHSNMQIAYGDVWIDFASDSITKYNLGDPLKHSSYGLTGTNNFYLTTNGNIALNQVGHVLDNLTEVQKTINGSAGQVSTSELRLFANTVMYISQRQQCQVCQSEQGGNDDIHFTHKIYSAEQLLRLADQSKYWITYPSDDCYLLMNDIDLLSLRDASGADITWSPIANFTGHFNANGHTIKLDTVEGTESGTIIPLFENSTGTLGEFSTGVTEPMSLAVNGTLPSSLVMYTTSRVTSMLSFDADAVTSSNNNILAKDQYGRFIPKTTGICALIVSTSSGSKTIAVAVIEKPSWNLGTDETKGLNSLVDTSDGRSTSVARVEGWLSALFGTEGDGWVGYTVVVDGTDGNKYSCITNFDGKYVISNTPCTGIMPAHVYRPNGTEVLEYGDIEVNVKASQWDTSMTTPLYLTSMPTPVKDEVVWEGEDAYLIEGSLVYPVDLSEAKYAGNIKWQFALSTEAAINGEWMDLDGTFVSGYETSVVFNNSGSKARNEVTLKINRADIAWNGYCFRAVFNTPDKRVLDTFAAKQDGYYGMLTVKSRSMYVTDPSDVTVYLDETAKFSSTCDFWQGANDEGFEVIWECRNNINSAWAPINGNSLIRGTVSNRVTAGTTDPVSAPVKTISTITIPDCATLYKGFQFRTRYVYNQSSAKTMEATLNVIGATLNVTSATNQELNVGTSGMNTTDTATYVSKITYSPSRTAVGTPNVDIKWVYTGGKDSFFDYRTRNWTQETANAEAQNLGLTAAQYPTINIINSEPVDNGDGTSTITSTMTIKNVHQLWDNENTRFYFQCIAMLNFNTAEVMAMSPDRAALQLIYACDIKWNDGVITETGMDNGNAYSDWTYPNMTVRSAAPIKTLIIKFDENFAFDSKDKIVLGGTLPGDAKLSGIPTSHRIVLTSVNGVSAADWQAYLRSNLSVYRSYDVRKQVSDGAVLYAYIDTKASTATAGGSSSLGSSELALIALGDTSKDTITFTQNPASSVVQKDSSVTLSATATSKSGSAVIYQWQVSQDNGATWINVVGETKRTYTINPFSQLYNKWQFRCLAGTATAGLIKASSVATITIQTSMNLLNSAETGRNWSFGSGSYQGGDTYLYLNGPGSSGSARRLLCSISGINLKSAQNITITQQMTSYSKPLVGGAPARDLSLLMTGVNTGEIIVSQPWYQSDDNGSRTYFFADSKKVANGTIALYFVNWAGSIGTCTASWTVTGLKILTASGEAVTPTPDPISRTSQSSYDRTKIYTTLEEKVSGAVDISATSKVYDGTEVNATVSIKNTEGLTPAQINEIISRATVRYNNGNVTPANGTGSGCKDVGIYTAELILDKFDVANYGLDGSTVTIFEITPRPVYVSSTGNNKVYDRTTAATIKNIAIEPLSGDSGVLAVDNGRVLLTNTEVMGRYKTFNQTNGSEVVIIRSGNLSLSGNRAFNYYIAGETYTGEITKRPVVLHSEYLENAYLEPDNDDLTITATEGNSFGGIDPDGNEFRNVKMYDGTTAAKIGKIIIDNVCKGDNIALNDTVFDGEYSQKDATQVLENGVAQRHAYFKLGELEITRTETLSLTNDSFGNYYIDSEHYTGAISRTPIEAVITQHIVNYGEGFVINPETRTEAYTSSERGYETDLIIDRLVGEDELVLDPKLSKFESSEPITKTTPVSIYEFTYTGLTEENYPVLSNYIIMMTQGSVYVAPLKLTITVDGGYWKYEGDENPVFGYTIDGFADNGDNELNSLVGAIQYATDCDKDSKPQYTDDKMPLPYEITASGLEVKANVYGLYNYELEYVPGTIVVRTRPITIAPPPTGNTFFDNLTSTPWGIAALSVVGISVLGIGAYFTLNLLKKEERERSENAQ